jgi:putative component of toxin-antitoxin plasmid stabilization module
LLVRRRILGASVNKFVMLYGGNKSSQERDIEQAKIIAKDWRD